MAEPESEPEQAVRYVVDNYVPGWAEDPTAEIVMKKPKLITCEWTPLVTDNEIASKAFMKPLGMWWHKGKWKTEWCCENSK
jgi:hypothetical protein